MVKKLNNIDENIFSTNDVYGYKYKPLQLSTIYTKFFGKLPADNQFVILLHGKPFSGKSSFALRLANELSRYKVLFANLEEKVGPTLQRKLLTLRIMRKIDFLKDNTFFNMQNIIKENKYKFVIIDSVSVFCRKEDEISELFNYIHSVPNTNFILIAHQTKAGSYRGSTNLAHLSDITIKLDDGIATTTKNRFLADNKIPEFYIYENKISYNSNNISNLNNRKKNGNFWNITRK